MKKFLLLSLLLLSSCRTTTTTTTATKTHSRDSLSMRVFTYVDSTFIDRNHTEKLHVGSDPVCSFRVDTLLVKDSIYIEKLRYLSLHDTICIVERDSIPYPVEVPIEVEKPVPRVYRYSLWFAILYLLYCLMRIMHASSNRRCKR